MMPDDADPQVRRSTGGAPDRAVRARYRAIESASASANVVVVNREKLATATIHGSETNPSARNFPGRCFHAHRMLTGERRVASLTQAVSVPRDVPVPRRRWRNRWAVGQ
jgi:hypothetical protein